MKHVLGDNEGAVADFKESISRDACSKTSYYYFYEQGFLKQHGGDFVGCIKNYDAAIKNLKALDTDLRINPAGDFDLSIFYHDRGLIKQKLRDSKGALADFNQEKILRRHETK